MKPYLLLSVALLSVSCVHGEYTEFYTQQGEVVGCDSYYSPNGKDWMSDAMVARKRYDNCVRRARRNGWTTEPPNNHYSDDDPDAYRDNLSDEEREELEKESERLKKEIKRLRTKRQKSNKNGF